MAVSAWVIAAVVPRIANIALPRSPSTTRFARNGISRMQTENRMLTAASSTSAVAEDINPMKLPALVMAAMLLTFKASINRHMIP
jgi:hypothetical protein